MVNLSFNIEDGIRKIYFSNQLSPFSIYLGKLVSADEYLNNFPHGTFRNNQDNVIKQICEAFNSGYKCIILEAPTGFGKSAISITVARTLRSSYICTATKDLQTQYSHYYKFLKVSKVKINFHFRVNEDFIDSGKYLCASFNSISEI